MGMRKGPQAHEEIVKDPLLARVSELFECDPNLTRVFSKDEWQSVLEKRRGKHRKFWGSQFDNPAQDEA